MSGKLSTESFTKAGSKAGKAALGCGKRHAIGESQAFHVTSCGPAVRSYSVIVRLKQHAKGASREAGPLWFLACAGFRDFLLR